MGDKNKLVVLIPMRNTPRKHSSLPALVCVIFLVVFTNSVSAAPPSQNDREIIDLLKNQRANLRNPAKRAKLVARVAAIENRRREQARAKALEKGLKLRSVGAKGEIREIVDFRGDQPIYRTTRNAAAAISSGANLLHSSPYQLDGSGVTVGIWDGGWARPSHREFQGRVIVMDNPTANTWDSHATHVTGTIAAAGITGSARGMAPSTEIDSYDWNSDISEITSRAATSSGQLATHLYLSNHSYGYDYGWQNGNWTATGSDQNAVDEDWGRYSSSSFAARGLDVLSYNAPYYLHFKAAGNETSDNPSNGDTVTIGGSSVTYNSAIHPPGDGKYLNGFGTIGREETAKNIVVVGAVDDAVSSGTRDLSKATLMNFSSTGPTDDGRIKPDLVANGSGLYSSDSTGDSSYTNKWGTSMATPSACGSAALMVELYAQLFNGGSMRACTLKGLLIHTADDLGNAGPDYKFGWGLINVKKAADLLNDHQAAPNNQHLTEDQISPSVSTRTYTASWDGVSPIRATLCWTDPAGPGQGHDSRTPVLVNDLDLKVTAPNGSEYFPYVMPYVGDWTLATINSAATTGVNHVDNVEQVDIAAPAQPGLWTVTVTYSGTLSEESQDFGLLLSGLVSDIYVSSPNGGEGFLQNTTLPITWSSPLEGNLSIDLYKDGSLDRAIISSTPNDGSHDWLIPSDVLGDGYTILITSVGNETKSDASNSSFSVYSTLPARLVDINADGTGRTASVSDFEAAAGLPAGAFSGSSVTHINFNDPTNASPPTTTIRTGTAGSITFQASSTASDYTLGGDADNWFGAGSDNNLLDDGAFMRSDTANPTGTITLSGSGLGLLANTTYDLYLFAGRSQGHLTSFTFDVANPTDFSSGATLAAGVPVIGGDETLGTVKFTFTTGANAPSSLVVGWDGSQNTSGNQDAVISGFALVELEPTPPTNTFANWIDGFGLGAGDKGLESDPDGDGMDNGLEAFFGTDPGVFSAGLTDVSMSGKVVSFKHPNPDTPLTDVTGSYQWSLDLSTWYAADGTEGDGSTTVTAVAAPNTPSVNTTTVEASIGGTEPDKIFLRVDVITP